MCLQSYEMNKETRGKCYIFNMENFKGDSKITAAAEDVNNINDLFTQLHFEVIEFKNLRAGVSLV